MQWLVVCLIIVCTIGISVLIFLRTKPVSLVDDSGVIDNLSSLMNQFREEKKLANQLEWRNIQFGRSGKVYRNSGELVGALDEIDGLLNRYNIPYVIFFGTLLGVIRDGHPIENDDDIDIIIDEKYYGKVMSMISENDLHVEFQKDHSFVQVFSSSRVAIDTYFYDVIGGENDTEVPQLHFNWNFQKCESMKHDGKDDCVCMRVPSDLILPTESYGMDYKRETSDVTHTEYNIPGYPITVLSFLYGARWREKLKKEKEYTTKCVNYIPTTTYFTQEKYWDQYYSSASVPLDASGFARFVHQQYMFECDSKHIDSPRRLLELGCGNARDTCFFQALDNIDCIAMDGSKEAIDKNVRKCPSAHFFCRDFETDEFPNIGKVDYVYTRWTLHSVNEHTENRMLDYMVECMHESSKLFIEVRTTDDAFYGRGEKVEGEEHAYNYGHYRRFIVADDLKSKLESNYGMSIDYFQVSDEFSVVHDDRPTLVRIVASLS